MMEQNANRQQRLVYSQATFIPLDHVPTPHVTKLKWIAFYSRSCITILKSCGGSKNPLPGSMLASLLSSARPMEYRWKILVK